MGLVAALQVNRQSVWQERSPTVGAGIQRLLIVVLESFLVILIHILLLYPASDHVIEVLRRLGERLPFVLGLGALFNFPLLLAGLQVDLQARGPELSPTDVTDQGLWLHDSLTERISRARPSHPSSSGLFYLQALTHVSTTSHSFRCAFLGLRRAAWTFAAFQVNH